MYNLTIVANQSGIIGLMQQTNSNLMMGMYGIMLLMALSLILFMAFFTATRNPKSSIAATSFLAWLTSLVLRALSLVPDQAVYITFIAMCISAAALFINPN